jgi:hypothetical protein
MSPTFAGMLQTTYEPLMGIHRGRAEESVCLSIRCTFCLWDFSIKAVLN